MPETSVFKFQKIFSGKIKVKAEKIARKFPGVTAVVGVPEEYSLKVTGHFVRFKLMKKLSKLDKNIDIIKIERVEAAPPLRNLQGRLINPPNRVEEVKPPQANGWHLPAVPQVLQPVVEQGQKVAKQIFAGALRYIRREEVKKEHPWNKRVRWNGKEFQEMN